jgi:hypothetical protein
LENLDEQLKNLFAKTTWTEQECLWFLDVLRQKPVSEFQEIFSENYFSNLTKIVPGDTMHASQLLKQIHEKVGIVSDEIPVATRSVVYRFRWVAAASVILLAGLGTYFYFNKKQIQIVESNAVVIQDVKPPQTTKAMIALANGQHILLDSIKNGVLAVEGNVSVSKKSNGEVIYNKSGKKDETIAYNTLSNPRGSKVVSLTLSDGTTVWLNSESSLTYPTAFVGKERKVSIIGEAYFEVAHNAANPFIVSKGNTEVKVLGTHFNVSAYDEDADIKITLLQGSIKVSKEGESKLITPGEEAIVSDKINVKDNIDLDKVMAWKNGVFNFDQENISVIMKELGRWYDADINYAGEKPTDLFSAIVKRDNNISQVLKFFEQTKRVHFNINGKKITVMK